MPLEFSKIKKYIECEQILDKMASINYVDKQGEEGGAPQIK